MMKTRRLLFSFLLGGGTVNDLADESGRLLRRRMRSLSLTLCPELNKFIYIVRKGARVRNYLVKDKPRG